MMGEKDIVYFTKENEELRYSLRSVEKNFPHKKVWFFGGCPNGLKPDIHVPVKQEHNSKYMNVREMIKLAIKQSALTDDFWLFNDDFFVMSKVGYVIPAVDGSLARKIQKIKAKYKDHTVYTRRLDKTIYACKSANVDRLNYELHVPMEVNKYKAAVVMELFNDDTAFRSAYGNYYNTAKMIHPDVKIYDPDTDYDPDVHNVYLSTSDASFANGRIGEYIRKTFTTPSRFETDVEIVDVVEEEVEQDIAEPDVSEEFIEEPEEVIEELEETVEEMDDYDDEEIDDYDDEIDEFEERGGVLGRLFKLLFLS